LRTASRPLAALQANCRVAPLNRTASLLKLRKGMNPAPETLRQSAQ
jgi:hypothetical protein